MKIQPFDSMGDDELNQLYTTFYEIVPLTIKQVGKHIRNQTGEFLKLIDV